jgi:hypothetical protein
MLVLRLLAAAGLVSSVTLAPAPAWATELAPPEHGATRAVIRRIEPAPPGATSQRQAPAPTPATDGTGEQPFTSGSVPGPAPPTGGSPPQLHVVPSDAAARIYLAQALASLGRAEQLAQQATQYGDVGTFDVDRFLEELRAISGGLQRFLVPESPPSGPHLPVEITGQYLYDALSRQRPRRVPSPFPQQEPRP